MSLRDIKSIAVWERQKERGAFSVKISCVSQGIESRFNEGPYKFFSGERGIRQAATTLLIRQIDQSIYRKICKMIHQAKRSKQRIIWENSRFPNEHNEAEKSFFQGIAMEFAEELQILEEGYKKMGVS